MNPLEALKQKLKVKPTVEQRKPVEVVLNQKEEEKEEVEEKKEKPIKQVKFQLDQEEKDEKQSKIPQKIEKLTIIDKRDQGFDRETLMKKLTESKLLKVTVKPLVKATEDHTTIAPITPVLKKAKKIKTKPKLIIEEESGDEEGLRDQEPKEEKPIEIIPPPAKKERKTKKVEKGITVLGPESVVIIGDTPLEKRLPQSQPKINIRVSDYYMNNREIFVNFINSIFEPYRKELQENKESISCDSIGRDSSDFSLLTHQKIVRDYMNLYTPYRGLLLYHGLGSGKCHLKGTPIMMFDGTIELVENIKVGDLLMGDDSTPRTVTSLAKGRDKMYDIISVKGEKYTVNEEHILCLRALGFPKLNYNNYKSNTNYNVQWIQNNNFYSKTFTFQEKYQQEEMKEKAETFFQEIKNNRETSENIIEISVKDYLELSDKKKSFLKGYKVAVDFEEKELPVDPYMIGYWLGDGSSNGPEINTQDSTVLYYFTNNLTQYGLSLNLQDGSYCYGISGEETNENNLFLKTLKELELQNNKHIPLLYKCNSRENRLKLLAGLIDSDGHYSNGVFEFTQKNEKLMDDVIFLARSLGFACYKSEKNTSWRICISGQGIEEIPTLIPRKRAEPKQQIKDVLVTGITVNYVKEDDYYGFTLNGNCRYIMGDFTVTHNTCTSIAIAEGMKSAKRVIIMTPASLRTNYIEELKKCGDLLYKKNQFWEWFSAKDGEVINTISSVLNLPIEYIRRKKGAWFINIQKKSNYTELSSTDKKSLDEQLDEMIRNKYVFINYNGLRNKRLEELTSGFTKNLFDNSIVIIDEAHNFVSRIVNKLKKEKTITESDKGEKDHAPKFLSVKLYEYLLSAQNSRVVLLTGTPVINYPNEFAILFNILRGYIKTWEITLDVKTNKKIDKNSLQEILLGEKTLDYLDYSPSSKTLIITRNPFGFKNRFNRDIGYQGVSNFKTDNFLKKDVLDLDFISDDDFERKIISILKNNDIDVLPRGVKIRNKKALPDTLELFEGNYIDDATKGLKNVDSLKRRILGLASYFRSAQESLLPKYNKLLGEDYHIIRIPMSNFQFKIYEDARKEERDMEKRSKRKVASNMDDLYKEPSSTYRIFSRLFCNFVMPERPMPKSIKMEYALDKMGETAMFESVYNKLKEQMTPGLDSILNQIEDEKERTEWNNKVEVELRSYVEDVINAQKKGKTASDKKLMNILKDIQKAEEIIAKTKENKKKTKEEIQNIGKRLEAFDVEQALLESGYKPEEREVNQEEKNTVTALLKEARTAENAQDLNNDQEGEIEGDEILEKIGGDEYKKRLEESIQFIEEHSNDFLTVEALETYSPKFLHILENIQDPEHVGLHLIYSQFRTLEGVGIFSLVLKKNGFAQFKIKKNTLGQWEIDIPEADAGKPTFALYSGTETAEEKEIIRNIYNGDWNYLPTNIANDLKKIANNNNMGEIIKVLMITSSGSEGINLRNTRYVHIMEPYWHPVRLEQVIGRARRICSHKDLPKNLQTVEVFVYLMIFSPEQLKSDASIELKRKDLSKSVPHVPVTSDQYLYEISEIKSNVTNQLTDIIKQSAFDCNIYSNGKCVNFAEPTNTKFSYVPDYSEQQSDITVKTNIQKVEWVGKSIIINGIEYVYKRVSPKVLNIYDKNSYLEAMKNPGSNPVLIGTYEVNDKGQQVFKSVR
jgi:hypothetical protein